MVDGVRRRRSDVAALTPQILTARPVLCLLNLARHACHGLSGTLPQLRGPKVALEPFERESCCATGHTTGICVRWVDRRSGSGQVRNLLSGNACVVT